MKNSPEEHTIRLEKAEERIRKLENRLIENITSEEQEERRVKKKEQILRNFGTP